MTTTIYKVLANIDGTPPYQSGFRWAMPKGKRPGKWMPRVERIELCESGYHGCEGERQLLEHLGPIICEMEFRGGPILRGDDKMCGHEARIVRVNPHWNERTARLFAADCAEAAIQYADPKTAAVCRTVLGTVRRYANGQATDDERSAARSAADSAADSAERNAAWSAERSEQAELLGRVLRGEVYQ